ncbi:MAG: hypothetical protein H8D96_13435 [Desulfobacterales bacterium]|uniref:DUF1573 domain-containing protein n=1 Tax=Candidatus Desulfatibia vada TaxID=2841696 RepID=A0A8J6TUD3_9BACT|nr:hypothetical protein [Candidatus Desulfatibia vada]MBL6971202.1 hypothetical protein [Desulfobacterales bacterium]
MKQKMMTVLLCFLFLFTINSVAAENIAKTAPKAVLTKRVFTFKPVVEGTTVTHDFILQNKGTPPLVIKKISTG